jgi:DNA replication factor GINS
MITKETLKQILRDEQSPEIKPIPKNIFDEFKIYIDDVENELKTIQNPHSVERKMLSDELQSALTDMDIIFMTRIKKVTSAATISAFATHRIKIPLQNLTEDEQKLFSLIHDNIKQMSSSLLDPLHSPKPKIETEKELKNEDENQQ